MYPDFTVCETRYKGYDGADTKISVVFDGKLYMLKFPKKRPSKAQDSLRASYANNPFSEYIGCHIFAAIGIPAQNTLLGTYRDKVVVACEDFVEGLDAEYQFQEFSKLENSFLDSDEVGSGRLPSLNNLNAIFADHERLKTIRNEAVSRYWDTFIVDALLGNFDRHSGNWGYFVNQATGEARLAPVYDCGSCLYPQLADEKIPEIMGDEVQIANRIYNYPLAALKADGAKVNYYEYIGCLGDAACTNALVRLVPQIDLDIIDQIIFSTPLMSDNRKEFLSFIVRERYAKILLSAYNAAVAASE